MYSDLLDYKNLKSQFSREIYSIVKRSGLFSNIQAEVYHPIATDITHKPMIEMLTTECASQYIDAKLTTEEEIDEICEDLRRLCHQEDGIMTYPSVTQVIGTKQ